MWPWFLDLFLGAARAAHDADVADQNEEDDDDEDDDDEEEHF